jgi:Mrp family chromosome partitioning ATPase
MPPATQGPAAPPAPTLYRPTPLRAAPALKPAPDGPLAPATEGGGLDAKFVYRACQYHWFLFLTLGTLIAGGLGTTAFLLVPAKYTSYALLNVAATDPQFLRSALDDAGHGDFVSYMKTQTTLIRSNQVLTRAVGSKVNAKNPGSPTIAQLPILRRVEDPIAWLETELKAEVPENSMVIKISLSGDEPEELRLIVDAVREAYMHEVVGKGKEGKTDDMKRLETLQENLRNHITAQNQKGPNDKPADPLTEKFAVAAMEHALDAEAKARGDAEGFKFKLLQLQGLKPPSDEEVLSTPQAKKALEEDLYTRRYEMVAIPQAEQALALDSQRYRRGSEEIELSRRALEKVKADAEAHKQKLRSRLVEETRSAWKQRMDAEVRATQLELDSATQRAKTIGQDVVRLKGELPASQAALTPRDKAIASSGEKELETLDDLNKKIERLKIEVNAPDRVVTVQPATLPVQKEIKKQLGVTAFATLFGFGLVAGLIGLFERRTSRVFSAADLEQQLRVPLLGSLPAPGSAGSAAPRSRKAAAEAERFTDAVDQVRSVLTQKLLPRRGQTVVVSGAAGGEGKSTLALHLALSLLQTSRKVLLVDGDFRSPRLHAWLGVPQTPGLGEVIGGEVKANEALTRTSVPNLWLMPAGSPSAQVRPFLSQGGLRGVLHRLKEDFDYVVIDSHAVLGGVDTALVAQQADAVVFAVRRHASRLPQVRKALVRLWETGTRKIGLVLLGDS